MMGMSGAKVVETIMKVTDKVKQEVHWLNFVGNYVKVPEVFVVDATKYVMENIPGKMLAGSIQTPNKIYKIKSLLNIIETLKSIPAVHENNVFTYTKRLNEHRDTYDKFHGKSEVLDAFDFCVIELSKNAEKLRLEASFCHGDLTLCNVIEHETTKALYLIDPNFIPNVYSSWLLDVSKIMQSLRGYEHAFGIQNTCNYLARVEAIMMLKETFKDHWYILRVLELSHWLRLLKYSYNIALAENIVINIVQELKNGTMSPLNNA